MAKSLWFFVLIGFLGVLIMAWKSIDTMESERPELNRIETPAILDEPVFYNYTDGKLKWETEAIKAEIFEASNKSRLYVTKSTLFSEKAPKKAEVIVLADNCELNGYNKISEFKNNVQIRFLDGRKLFTERVYLDQDKQILYNNEATKIDDFQGQIRASSFFYDIQLKKLDFESPTTLLILD